MFQYKENIINNFAVQVFNVVLSFIISIIVSRQLGPTNKGNLTFFMLIADLFCNYGHLGVINATTYFQTRKNYNRQFIYRVNLTYNLFICGITTICFFCLYKNKILFVNYSKFLFLCFLAYTLLTLLKVFLNTIYVGDERIKEMNRYYVISSIISSSLIIINIKNINLETYLIIKIVEMIINDFLLFIKSGYKYKFTLKINIIIEEIKYGVNPLLANLCIYLNYKVDLFLIKFFVGNTELGLYALAVSLAELVLIIPQAISNPITARLYNLPKESKERKEIVIRTLRYGFTSCIIISCLGIMCIPLIPIVYSLKYKGSMIITFILFFSIPFVSIGKITIPYFYSSGNVSAINKFSFISLLINTVLNLILIPKFHGIGAAIASTFSYLAYGIQYINFFKKEFNVSSKELLLINRKDLTLIIKEAKEFLKISRKKR